MLQLHSMDEVNQETQISNKQRETETRETQRCTTCTVIDGRFKTANISSFLRLIH